MNDSIYPVNLGTAKTARWIGPTLRLLHGGLWSQISPGGFTHGVN
jgi:hypothetical protein